MRTLTPTRPIRAHRGIEPSPRRSQRRVLPLHQKRHHPRLAATEGGARLANNTTQRKRRDSNPHRPIERPRLANACDEPIFASLPKHLSFMPPPGLEPGLQASQARVVIHSTTGTHFFISHISPPGLEPGTQRSKRRMIVHFTTGMYLSSEF